MTRTTTTFNRRSLIKGSIALATTSWAYPSIAAGARPQILILGAGAGGASAARTLKQLLGNHADITAVIGEYPLYHAPFLGTSVLLGQAVPPPVNLPKLFARAGINVAQAEAVRLIRTEKTLEVRANGQSRTLRYDILVASPGISLDHYGKKSSNERAKEALCWTSSAQCVLQADTIRSLKPGATLVFVAPPQPYRCPPSIYERVCLMAHLLKPVNPTAKILILDEKDTYPMQELFETAYGDYYDGMIEWIPKNFHGGVTSLDPVSRTVKTATEAFQADFLQALPPQSAPSILKDAGLVNERGYCPVLAPSMRSAMDENIFVIGDAADMVEMSKSAVSATVQGRLAARHIATHLSDKAVAAEATISDNCWTFVAPDDAITLGGTYKVEGSKFVPIARHVSSPEEDARHRSQNAKQARAWPAQMLQQIFGERP